MLAFDSVQVEKLFRAEVLRLLVARGKISEDVVENLLTWRQSGFSVHAGVRVEERSEAVRLGRYGIRCPLVLERLEWDESSDQVVYRARPGRQDARGESVARWNVLEFLARVLDHLPNPGQQLLRYWGWYSNFARERRQRQRGESSAKPRTVTDPADAEGLKHRLTWSQLIRKVYEIDPLLCSYCGASMSIVSILIDFASLRRLLAHLDFAPQRPEPPDETKLYVSNAWLGGTRVQVGWVPWCRAVRRRGPPALAAPQRSFKSGLPTARSPPGSAGPAHDPLCRRSRDPEGRAPAALEGTRMFSRPRARSCGGDRFPARCAFIDAAIATRRAQAGWRCP